MWIFKYLLISLFLCHRLYAAINIWSISNVKEKDGLMCSKLCVGKDIDSLPLDPPKIFKEQSLCLASRTNIISQRAYCIAPVSANVNTTNLLTSDFESYLNLSKNMVSWFEAVKYCHYFRLNILNLDGAWKPKQILDFLRAKGLVDVFEDVWVGGFNLAIRGAPFHWVDSGQRYDKSASSPLKPLCLYIKKVMGESLKILASECKDKKRFMCELPSVCSEPLCKNSGGVGTQSSSSVISTSVSTVKPSTSTTQSITSTTSSTVQVKTTTALLKIPQKGAKGSCVEPVCPKYTCNVEKALFLENGALNDVAVQKIGVFKAACGKRYFFSKKELRLKDAMTACCALNLTLLSIETHEEGNCVCQAYQAPVKANDDFMVSLTDDGCEGKFMWCTTNQTKNFEVLWGNNQPDNHLGIENCVTIQLTDKKYVLADRKCFNTYRYICEQKEDLTVKNSTNKTEVKSSTPEWTSMDLCNVAECRVNISVNLTDLKGDYRKLCNKQYYFSDISMNFTEAAAFCCAKGLRLLSMNSKAEVDCIFKEMPKLAPGRLHIRWIAGMLSLYPDPPGQWTWCSGAPLPPIRGPGAWIKWREDRPTADSTQKCASIVYKQGGSGLSDAFCYVKTHFICGPKSNYTTTTVVMTTTTPSIVTATSTLIPSKNKIDYF